MMTSSARSEQERIAFLLGRDGPEATAEWVRRTLRIYRRAVLTPGHFAGLPEFRRGFIESYCAFRRWLANAQG
jgi:plasmid stabilization system protein ParE